MDGPVLLLTHSGDYYTIDRVEEELAALGAESLRVDTDAYPAQHSLTTRFDSEGSGLVHLLDVAGRKLDLGRVPGVWSRRLWPGRIPDAVDARYAHHCRVQSRLAFFETVAELSPRGWMNPFRAMRRAESKLEQLAVARRVGLTVPNTVVTNDPDEVRAFFAAEEGRVVTKLLGALSQTMDGSGEFMYTSRVNEAHLEQLEGLRLCPQVFQREVKKVRELRVIVVDGELYVGAVDASESARGQVDWRRSEPGAGLTWSPAELPEPHTGRLLAVLAHFGLRYVAADFVVDELGDYYFLEINPAGEWGWLERDLELPIAAAIARGLVNPPES